MVKTLFEGQESDLLISKKQNEIEETEVVIEMLDKGCNLNDYQLGDNYNIIFLNKKEALYLGQLLLQLVSDGEQ